MRANTVPRNGAAVSASSKQSKFSSLRNLPAAEGSATATVSPAASSLSLHDARIAVQRLDVADTVRRVQARERAEEAEDETDERIRQHRYAQLVARLSTQRSQYYSTEVFVEAMLKEAQHAAPGSPATVAAVATWGLRILARESRSTALTSVMEALLPAVYCQYAPGQGRHPSPAVQLQVRDAAALEDNPYFTHAMFVDEAHSGKRSTAELRQALEAAVGANDRRRSVLMRCLERQERARLALCFRGWRNSVRQNRLLQLISNNQAKREATETAVLRKQAIFYQWKLVVEQSRSAYLTERLHDAAFQLENAKNQFQLQCYRADRLVQAAKDATGALAQVSQENAALTSEVAQLKQESISRERHFNWLLTHSTTRLMRLLGTYDELSRVFVQSRRTAVRGSAAVRAAEAGPSPHASSASNSPLDRLRQWVDALLADVRGQDGPFRPLRALGPDFADGERYLHLLQIVFPEEVGTVTSMQSMGVEVRLRRIRDYAAQCKLRYVLTPADFAKEREELLVCSLFELHQRHLARNYRHAAAQSVSALETFRESALLEAVQTSTASPAVPPSPAAVVDGANAEVATEEGETEDVALLTAATVTASIAEHVRRLQRISGDLEAALTAETAVLEASAAMVKEESRLGCERMQGTPIPLVEEASRGAFWQLPANALNDLRDEPQLLAESRMWDVVVTQSLPQLLRSHVDLTSRLFFFFAGDNAKTLSEVGFWRFVEASGVLVSPADVLRQWIVTQYDLVVSPQLNTALTAAARNQSEMTLQKLRDVAYQEMDIRSATPLQFVQLLVRIAVASENGEYGLLEGTQRLLQRLQLPSRERMAPVLAEMVSPEAQSVLRYFYEDLFRTFLFYVRQQETSRNAQERAMATQHGGRFSAQMSIITLLSLLDECRFLSDGGDAGTAPPLTPDGTRPRLFVSTAHVRRLVTALERQSKVPTTGSLYFGLFVDVLAALAHHWCPDPLVPASRRLAAFLAYVVQQLNEHHTNSTLLLGSIPFVSLDGPKAVDFAQDSRPSSATHLKSGR